MNELNIKIELNGLMYQYNPKPTITAQEAALMNIFLVVCTAPVACDVTSEMKVAYITKHKLWDQLDLHARNS